MTKATYLPEGDEALKEGKNYWRPSQMQEGENRLRIVQRPIAGFLDWQDKRPIRYRPDNKPKLSFDPAKPLKKFWICYVWDYKREGLYVLEITQSGVLSALRNYISDADYGDPTTYDIKISKKGTGKDTEYFVTATPPKAMDKGISKALEASPVNLEALYDAGDPWKDLEAPSASKASSASNIDQELYSRVHLLLEKSPIKEGLLKGFCTAYHISSLIEATQDQLKQLEKRILESQPVIKEK